MHSVRIELAKIDFSRHEDNLPSHRGRRYYVRKYKDIFDTNMNIKRSLCLRREWHTLLIIALLYEEEQGWVKPSKSGEKNYRNLEFVASGECGGLWFRDLVERV